MPGRRENVELACATFRASPRSASSCCWWAEQAAVPRRDRRVPRARLRRDEAPARVHPRRGAARRGKGLMEEEFYPAYYPLKLVLLGRRSLFLRVLERKFRESDCSTSAAAPAPSTPRAVRTVSAVKDWDRRRRVLPTPAAAPRTSSSARRAAAVRRRRVRPHHDPRRDRAHRRRRRRAARAAPRPAAPAAACWWRCQPPVGERTRCRTITAATPPGRCGARSPRPGSRSTAPPTSRQSCSRRSRSCGSRGGSCATPSTRQSDFDVGPEALNRALGALFGAEARVIAALERPVRRLAAGAGETPRDRRGRPVPGSSFSSRTRSTSPSSRWPPAPACTTGSRPWWRRSRRWS